MQPTPTVRDAATAALGQDVALWIDGHRNSPARLSYQQIANVLVHETGVSVSREYLRQWHAAYTAASAA